VDSSGIRIVDRIARALCRLQLRKIGEVLVVVVVSTAEIFVECVHGRVVVVCSSGGERQHDTVRLADGEIEELLDACRAAGAPFRVFRFQ
jgi:hypothetical protein